MVVLVLYFDGPLAGVASFRLDLINVILYDFDKALVTNRTSMSISGAQPGLSHGVSPFPGLSASIGVTSL